MSARRYTVVLGLLAAALANPATAWAQDDASRTLVEQGRYWRAQGKPDQAVQAWQKLLLIDPRQPEALYWNCGQLAVALRSLVESAPLMEALERFGPLYMANVRRRWLWRLGLLSQGDERDAALIAACEAAMTESGESPARFFLRHRHGERATGELAEALRGYVPAGIASGGDDFNPGPTMVIDEVEEIWAAIAKRDDWSAMTNAVDRIRALGEFLGQPPLPSGHLKLAPA